MPTRPAALARAAVATRALSCFETHVSDTWICGSLSFIVIFNHPPEDFKKKEKEKRKKAGDSCACYRSMDIFLVVFGPQVIHTRW